MSHCYAAMSSRGRRGAHKTGQVNKTEIYNAPKAPPQGYNKQETTVGQSRDSVTNQVAFKSCKELQSLSHLSPLLGWTFHSAAAFINNPPPILLEASPIKSLVH